MERFIDGIVSEKDWSALEQAFAGIKIEPNADHLDDGLVKTKKSRLKGLQLKLAILGYYDGPLNGVLTEETRFGLEKFQLEAGLEMDGADGIDILAALDDAFNKFIEPPQRPNLRIGASGAFVAQLQSRLAECGCYHSIVDGSFGPETAEAIQIFQRRRGLLPDAIVGPTIWDALEPV